jgi:hypothetical protein
MQWEKAVPVPVLKKGNSSSVSTYRAISVLNNLSKVFEFVTHDHIAHCFKHELNSSQHDF